MKRIAIAVFSVALALAAVVRLHADDKKANVLIDAGLAKETIQGDLQGAIAQFEKAVKEAGANRALAAKALMQMAECYRKLGDSQAGKIYERVVRDYADQKDAVTIARAGLGAMGTTPGSGRQTFELISDDVDKVSHCEGSLPLGQPLEPCTDYSRTGDLTLWNIATGETRYLIRNGPDPKGKVNDATISADAEMVIYSWNLQGPVNQTQEIRVINSDGTGMRTLVSRTFALGAGANWGGIWVSTLSPDKKTAVVQADHKLQILSLDDGSLKPFGDASYNYSGGEEPVFSPDGKHVAFTKSYQPFIANADGREVRTLIPESGIRNVWGNLVWSPDGRWIVFSSLRSGSRAIWAVPANGGTPRLLREISDAGSLLGITRDGSVYYRTTSINTDIQVAQMNASGAITGEPSRFINTFLGHNMHPSFSPDESSIAWGSFRSGGNNAPVYVVRPAAGGTELVGDYYPLTWFPDSKALLRWSVDNGQTVFKRVEVSDGRITEIYRGTDFKTDNGPFVITDGDALVGFRCHGSPSQCDLVRYDLRTRSETVETLRGIQSVAGGPLRISPDGKWLALAGRLAAGGDFRLFVKPTAGGGPVEIRDSVATKFRWISWTPDSKQIVFSTAPDNQLRAVPIDGGAPKIFPLKSDEVSFDPSGRIAYTVSTERNGLWVAHNLLPSN